MKINFLGIGLGIIWSLVIVDYALSFKTTFWIYSLAVAITGILVGSDIVFYQWNKEKKDERRIS